ncbi:MAG: hypothetical protein VX874_14245 [Pseudomonadota bacterium]|nr:hypothetical protein [Pseudomonadota bacterium]
MVGEEYASIRNEYGHELLKMWQSPDLAELRHEIEILARKNWETARASGKYVDTFSDDPKLLLAEQVDALDRLHSRKSDYALRYVSRPNETVPLPTFLVETFGVISQRLSERYLLSKRAAQYA